MLVVALGDGVVTCLAWEALTYSIVPTKLKRLGPKSEVRIQMPER